MLAGFNLFYFAMISSSKKKGIFSFGPRLFLKCLKHSFPIMLMQGDDVAALQRNVGGEKSTHTKRHIAMETSEVFTWSRWCSFVTVLRMWESPVRRCGIVFWRVLVWHPPSPWQPLDVWYSLRCVGRINSTSSLSFSSPCLWGFTVVHAQTPDTDFVVK